MTRREILLSACALAGAPSQLSGAQAQNNVQQSTPTSQAPAEAVSLSDYEALARERIPHAAYEYISGGAADEITLRWNREAFDRIRLKPQILVDVSKLDTRLTLFGQELPFPILLGPTSYHRLVHPEGEIATVKGAGAAGATMVAGMLATTAIEEMAKAATGPLWFQTYILKDRGFTRDLIQRAEGVGCKAICVTVDSPVVGVRNRDQRAHFSLPPEMERANLKGLLRPGGNLRPAEGEIYAPFFDASLTWKEIDWLRSFARVPVLLKGVLNPADAEQAVKALPGSSSPITGRATSTPCPPPSTSCLKLQRESPAASLS
jgi:4-hydroxymandelate oxidase